MTDRDSALLTALTLKVRVLSLAQVARTWWDGAEARAARARLRTLVRGGWLVEHALTAHPELPLTTPLLVWEVGQGAPSFGALAYRLTTRWRDESRQLTVFTATRRAAAVLGGYAPHLTPMSVTHDLHVAALYLRFLADRPDDARDWVSEDALAPARDDQVLPDAALVDAEGRLRRVIEFGGRYRAERLRALHADCAARALPYELW